MYVSNQVLFLNILISFHFLNYQKYNSRSDIEIFLQTTYYYCKFWNITVTTQYYSKLRFISFLKF